MKQNIKPLSYYQAGFSLVEIMVGLVIGLIATLVILQVFSVFEGQKRTTTGVADAQINGSISLHSIKRELMMAGFGLQPFGEPIKPDSAIECTTLDDTDATTTGIKISPVIITDGGIAAGNSDSITLRYSTSNMGGAPVAIKGVGVPALLPADQILVDTNFGCQTPAVPPPVNPANFELALIVNGSACMLKRVTNLSAPAASATSATITLDDPSGVVAFSNISCLGTWHEITFRANGGNLERQDLPLSNVFEPAIAGIVNLQAQYGVSSAPNSNHIQQWVDATGSWDAATLSATNAASVFNRNRIKAIRIAIVARNGLAEKEDVSLPCDSLVSNAPNGLCAWSATSLTPDIGSPAPRIELSNDADGTSWQRYRYRVFETVIPLRNMIWSKGTL